MTQFIRLFREANVPITELMSGGGGTPQDLSTAAAEQEAAAAQEALKSEAYGEDGNLKEGYELAEDGVTIKKSEVTTNDPEEGLNADGTLQEGYERDADGKIVKIESTNEDDIEVTPEKFFEEVQKLTGREIPVEYPENIDPLSPEGVAHRDSVIWEMGAQAFEQELAKGDPRAYAYAVHRKAGGTDEEFFNSSASFTLPEKADLEKDADAQAALFRSDLKAKGLDDTMVETLVKAAIADNTLKDKSLKIHDNVIAEQARQQEDIQNKYKAREELINKSINSMLTSIQESMTKEMSFVVPETNKAEFASFVQSHIQYDEDTNSFVLVESVSKENLKATLDALFFKYKKGDLSAIVSRQAKTKAAQTLRLNMKDNKGLKGGNNNKNNDTDFVPLGSLTKR